MSDELSFTLSLILFVVLLVGLVLFFLHQDLADRRREPRGFDVLPPDKTRRRT